MIGNNKFRINLKNNLIFSKCRKCNKDKSNKIKSSRWTILNSFKRFKEVNKLINFKNKRLNKMNFH